MPNTEAFEFFGSLKFARETGSGWARFSVSARKSLHPRVLPYRQRTFPELSQGCLDPLCHGGEHSNPLPTPEGLVGRGVLALYRDEELCYHGARRALSVPTCDEHVIYETALAVVEEKLGGFPEGVSLVGVRVGGLEPVLRGFPWSLFPL